ncbi:hypothetical protein KKG58_01630 [Patescibacteria group bacterium]|nr:hypothetical protein [Patescibacteria group bacterium]
MDFDSKKDKKNRIIFSIIYGLIGVFLIIVSLIFLGSDFMFYNNEIKSINNYPRFLWSLSWCFIGFSLIAYQSSRNEHNVPAIPVYIIVYFPTLIMISLLVFGFLHIFQSTSNYLFYCLSAPMSFIMSFGIDRTIPRLIDTIFGLRR